MLPEQPVIFISNCL